VTEMFGKVRPMPSERFMHSTKRTITHHLSTHSQPNANLGEYDFSLCLL
jgi:hypothetical protein